MRPLDRSRCSWRPRARRRATGFGPTSICSRPEHILPAIRFRPIRPEDRAFLFEVYAGTRAEELAPVPWTAGQKLVFLNQQFEAQDKDYRANYNGADFLVIEVDGRDEGRLYVLRSPEEILIIDIALLPEARGKGIGTRILTGLLNEAGAAKRRVAIHVEHFNPALRLYQRLGFRMVEKAGIHFLMVHDPGGSDRAN